MSRGRKTREDGPPQRKGAALMQQLGFGGMDDMENMLYGNVEDDEDLEAELHALIGNDAPAKTPGAKRNAPVSLMDIDRMAAQGMQDVDEDVSDTEDPDLLAELQDLATEDREVTPSSSSETSAAEAPSPAKKMSPASDDDSSSGSAVSTDLVQDRITMYRQARENAISVGDTSKQRRLERGLKTLEGTLKKVKAGKAVSPDDVPPPVAVSAASPSTPQPASIPGASHPPTPPSRAAAPSQGLSPQNTAAAPSQPSPQPPSPASPPQPTTSKADAETRQMLVARRDQYKHAALHAKRSQNIPAALEFVKVSKQFDAVIAALDQGKPVDLSKMPPPPPATADVSKERPGPPPETPLDRSANQAAGDKSLPPETEMNIPPPPSEEEEKQLFQAPDAPKSVMEALEQRLAKYKSSEESAKASGDSSKARRMGRICKQYQDAIKAHKAGRPVDFEELPTPPGFGPIPVGAQASAAAAPAPAPKPAAPRPSPAPSASPSATAAPHRPAPQPPQGAARRELTDQQIARIASQRKPASSRQEQQTVFLKERYAEFKKAALEAKRNNDLELAKKYLRNMKGMEQMIAAAESGLPVDLSQVPDAPRGDEDPADKFVVVSAEDCQPAGDREEVFKKLQQDLLTQIRTCATNSQHFSKLGDVASASRFKKMEENCRKDLDALKNSFRHGDPAPKFHYENRTFSMVRSHLDLGDGELEFTVVRGIQFNLPSGYAEKDLNTYVKYEFPYPNETPQEGHSETVKGSINPEYDEMFKVQMERKSRGFLRVVERKALKLEVYYKRGLFKGDKLLGAASVKLQPLENVCTIHDSFDLVDGRKPVGGKLEVKVRIREPFKQKQVDEVREKWLVIDQFLKTAGSTAAGTSGTQAPKKPDGTTCMEVLRYEKQLLDKQISNLKDSLTPAQLQTLKHKSSLLQEKWELQQVKLKEGGVEAFRAYVAVVDQELASFEQEARQLAKMGDIEKAQVMLTKKKLAEKEVTTIRAKVPNL